ncbi:hypothetical protein ACFOOK_28285 [Micromonospora krabiensis]|uniref:Uncharacterized protein n=1 Tax=Micromonospora krabiensis TaxID=307121 RepID=A0A1C3N4M1_9ACTN|nr:hypothetical protein [Micromonospora krabiensis]SBV27531.1 hypothetical protein GA0070620_3055 [Micromonospora krabiensis]
MNDETCACHIAFGPVSGTWDLAAELMRWFGADPDRHPEAHGEIADAIGEEMLDTGLAILRERGIPTPAVTP